MERCPTTICADGLRRLPSAPQLDTVIHMAGCRHAVALAALLVAVTVTAGCEGGDVCLDNLSTECTPAYSPTFDNVFSNMLQPKCATTGGCHGQDTAAGGLTFASANGSHALLTGQVDGVARVLEGDPACSVLVQVLESDKADYVMPPSGKLPAAERCAVIQWVAAGAKR